MQQDSPSQEIINLIKGAIGDEPPLYAFNAPIKTSVQKHDGTFKTMSFSGEEEFLLTGVREGRRNQFILEFEPVDAQEYAKMELSKPGHFETMNGLEDFLCETIGYSETPTWEKAVKAFERDFRKRQELKAQEARQAEEDRNKDNPMWGMF